MPEVQRTPYPSIDTTAATGYEWFDRFMMAQASVAGNALFAAFKIGQLGVAGHYNRDLARAMLADLRTDRADILFATEELCKVIDEMAANIERNLGPS